MGETDGRPSSPTSGGRLKPRLLLQLHLLSCLSLFLVSAPEIVRKCALKRLTCRLPPSRKNRGECGNCNCKTTWPVATKAACSDCQTVIRGSPLAMHMAPHESRTSDCGADWMARAARSPGTTRRRRSHAGHCRSHRRNSHRLPGQTRRLTSRHAKRHAQLAQPRAIGDGHTV